MRADRLVATLLLLQSNGRSTAADIAAELEISERTARRDLEALSMAGVPVYSTSGRGGGWSLIGGARTDLTGLTAGEAQALMMVTGSAPTASADLKAAVRKLVQALPESFRDDATAATESVVVDSARWGRPSIADDTPFLVPLQDAVVGGTMIELGYRTPKKEPSLRRVAPLGLVVKAAVWYLVAGTDDGARTFRVSRVSSVAATDEPFERPAGFDLEETWRLLSDRFNRAGASVVVDAIADPAIHGPLGGYLGSRITFGEVQPDGRTAVAITAPSEFMAAVDLAPFGGGVEVLGPVGVRTELARIGTELVERYRPS